MEQLPQKELPDSNNNGLARRARRHKLLGMVLHLLEPVAFLLLLLVLAVWDGRLVGAFVASTLSRSIGGEVTIERFDWTSWGCARLDGLVLRVPQWRAEGAQIASVNRVQIAFDPITLLWGPLHIRTLRVDGVEVAVVESPARQNSYNLQMLEPAGWSSPASGAATIIDQASIDSFSIDFKRLTKSGVAQLGRYEGSFNLAPDKGTQRSIVEMIQRNGPVRMSGWINQSTLEFDIAAKGLEVNKSLTPILPRYLRGFAEESDAVGKVTTATIAYSPERQFVGTVELEDVQATLPRGELGKWVRYEDGRIVDVQGSPKFLLRKGTINLDGSKIAFQDLDFDLLSTSPDGRVAVLPVRASLSADFAALPTAEFQWEDRARWMEQVRDVVPFELRVTIPNFQLGRTAQSSAVELPEVAAKFLYTFHVAEMNFDFSFLATRPAPTVASDGTLSGQPMRTSGTLVITDARGAFDGFPYPLSHVQSTVRFDGSTAILSDLRGQAPGGETVLVKGQVTNMSEDFGVDISVATASAPVDSTLLDCFPPASRQVLQSLFWTEGFDKLRAAGVLFDKSQVQDAQVQLPLLESKLRELSADPMSDPTLLGALSTQIGQLRRMIDRGAFTPGGQVAFTLRLQRPEDHNADVAVTGSVRILNGDILPTMFPYPIRTKEGELTLLPDRIDLGGGIAFQALDGAVGRFSGTIDIVPTDNSISFAPHLRFSLEKDQMGPLFYMAIPPDAGDPVEGWPGATLSTGGQLLSMLDVRGDLTIRGVIDTDAKGEVDLTCKVQLARGSVHPQLAEDDPLQSTGVIWPTGFGLDDCEATVHIVHDRIEVESFGGFRGEGRIEASGFALLDSTERSFEVRLRQVQLADYAVSLVPFDERPRARELWNRYRPTGLFDADILLGSTAEDPKLQTELTVTPSRLGLTLRQGPIGVEFHQGTLVVHDDDVRCDALSATVSSEGGFKSAICLDGTYGASTGELDLAGSVADGVIHGPLMEEILELTQSVGARRVIEEFDPHGRYDAEFSYSAPAGSAPGSFNVDARISELSLGSPSARIDLLLESPARIQAMGEQILLHPMHAGFVGGSVDAAGWLTTDSGGAIESGLFDLSVVAHGTGAQLVAALPEAARAPLSGIGFGCRDTLEAHASIELRRERWLETHALASISLIDAVIAESPKVENLNCMLWCEFHDVAKGSWFTVTGNDATLELAGRQLSDARIRLTNHGTANGELRGELLAGLGGGVMTISAGITQVAPFRYDADVAVSGCNLSALTLAADGVPTTAAPAPREDPGLVDARFAISGDSSGISSRLGRGSALVRKAELARLPIALALLQVTQLSPTLDSTVTRGDFDFTIDGHRLFFDRFDLTCKDILLNGQGWLDTESGELALRLRNRGTTPFLSDILTPVTNQIFQIDVRGTLQNPIGDLAPLPGIVPPPTLSPAAPVAMVP